MRDTTLKPLLAAAALMLFTIPLAAVGEATVTEWKVPWDNTRPRDPYIAPGGDAWFCGQGGGYLARFDPASGDFRRYELEQGEGPHNLIIDGDGFVWYAGNRTGHIGRLDPRTGEITKFEMPDPRARDPHTLIWDSRGNIWFTVQHGNFVGRLITETGHIDLVEVPTPGARPYGIVVDENDRPWIALFGTSRLATVDPDSLELTEIPLPRSDARPRRLALTSGTTLWYGDYAQGKLGRYLPGDGSFKEWTLPGGTRSWPYGMAADDAGQIWIVETGLDPNRLVAFDPATQKFVETVGIESGGGTVRHIYFHPPSDELWFGTDTNYLARFQVP